MCVCVCVCCECRVAASGGAAARAASGEAAARAASGGAAHGLGSMKSAAENRVPPARTSSRRCQWSANQQLLSRRASNIFSRYRRRTIFLSDLCDPLAGPALKIRRSRTERARDACPVPTKALFNKKRPNIIPTEGLPKTLGGLYFGCLLLKGALAGTGRSSL